MTQNGTRRVVITGLGAVSDIGHSAPSMWSAMKEGRSGIGTIQSFDQTAGWAVTIAGEVRDWSATPTIDAKELKRMDRFCALGLYAAIEAAADCGIDFTSGDPYRRGVVIGSGIGGIMTIEDSVTRLCNGGPRKISPFTVPRLMVNACAGNVSINLDLRGANSVTVTACASGGHALGTGYHLIQRGDAEVILGGGAEAAVSPLCIGSFSSMKALSTRNDDPTKASRPFDQDRDGFVMAEGGAVLVMEELEHAKSRGAKIYAELKGFGTSGDAQHIAAPDPTGAGAKRAMEIAIKDAGINSDDVDYINAHGTSTPLGDAAEVQAVESLFGDHARTLAMSSTKSMTGHTLGAAGGIESVATVMAVREGVMPPTINLDHPDEGFHLNFVANKAQEKPLRHALNNSFGFGGHNVSLVFSRYEGD